MLIVLPRLLFDSLVVGRTRKSFGGRLGRDAARSPDDSIDHVRPTSWSPSLPRRSNPVSVSAPRVGRSRLERDRLELVEITDAIGSKARRRRLILILHCEQRRNYEPQ